MNSYLITFKENKKYNPMVTTVEIEAKHNVDATMIALQQFGSSKNITIQKVSDLLGKVYYDINAVDEEEILDGSNEETNVENVNENKEVEATEVV